MTKNTLIASLSILTLGLSSLGAQTITGFGAGDYGISFGPGSIQNASSFSVSGTDDDILVNGTVTQLAFLDFATRQLSFTATLTVANSTTFSIELLDAANNSAVFEGAWSDFTVNVPTTVTLDYANDGGFDGTIRRVLVVSASGGGDNISFSADSLSIVPTAVPEPSTYASIAGVAMLGFVAYRRRRVAA